MWIQRAARVSAGHAWRIAFVLAGLLAASLVYGEIGGRTGAQVALAVFLVVLAVAWPRRSRGQAWSQLVPPGRRRRRLAALEAELAQARASLEEEAAEREHADAELLRVETALRELGEASAAQAAAAAGRIAEANAQLAMLERVRAADQARLADELRARARAVVELEQALQVEVAARRRAEAAAVAAEERAAALAADPASDTGPHVAFFALGGRYRLVAREGPAPSPGTPVVLPDGGVLVVAKVGRSPLPGDTRRCAFLGGPAGGRSG